MYDVTDGSTTLATYSYGASNQRLQMVESSGENTLYAWEGGSVIAEYNGASNGMAWTKSYIYLGGRLLATEAPLTTSTTEIKYHHPDRLGTRLVTSSTGAVVSENVSLPFGATISGESLNLAGSASKKRFTSYDRSDTTKLDYAVNRHYSSAQGRFTQVDPLEMDSVEFEEPQSLNLYTYCGNDPINQIDPDGLFSLKNLFGGIQKIFSNVWVRIAVLVAILVLTAGLLGPLAIQPIIDTMVIGIAADGTAITIAVVGATQLTAAGWATIALSAASGISLSGFGIGATTPPFIGSFQKGPLPPPPPPRGGGRGSGGRGTFTPPFAIEIHRANNRNRNRARESRFGGLSTTDPSFPNLRDHASRHGGGMSTQNYYQAAMNHVSSGNPQNQSLFTFRVRAYHDGQFKWNYVSRVGPDNFIFSSTSLNGKVIFTHLRDRAVSGGDVINLRYLQNKGITLPVGF